MRKLIILILIYIILSSFYNVGFKRGYREGVSLGGQAISEFCKTKNWTVIFDSAKAKDGHIYCIESEAWASLDNL